MISNDPYTQAIEYYAQMMVDDCWQCFWELWHTGFTWKGRALLVPLNIFGGNDMARGKGTSSQKPAAKSNWSTTFVDIPLTGHTWDDVIDKFDTVETVYDQATAMLEDGYRLGFSYNPQNDAFICSVTCKDEQSVNSGKTFTAFAGSWFEALQAALYKHYVVAGQNWNGGVAKGDQPRFG